jgi:DNA polymerase V
MITQVDCNNFYCACERLIRRQMTVVGHRTDRLREDQPQYRNAASTRLAVPTADVAELTGIATRMLAGIYREGYRYKKASVMMLDLQPDAERQTELFDPLDRPQRGRVLDAYDVTNQRWGRGLSPPPSEPGR